MLSIGARGLRRSAGGRLLQRVSGHRTALRIGGVRCVQTTTPVSQPAGDMPVGRSVTSPKTLVPRRSISDDDGPLPWEQVEFREATFINTRSAPFLSMNLGATGSEALIEVREHHPQAAVAHGAWFSDLPAGRGRLPGLELVRQMIAARREQTPETEEFWLRMDAPVELTDLSQPMRVLQLLTATRVEALSLGYDLLFQPRVRTVAQHTPASRAHIKRTLPHMNPDKGLWIGFRCRLREVLTAHEDLPSPFTLTGEECIPPALPLLISPSLFPGARLLTEEVYRNYRCSNVARLESQIKIDPTVVYHAMARDLAPNSRAPLPLEALVHLLEDPSQLAAVAEGLLTRPSTPVDHRETQEQRTAFQEYLESVKHSLGPQPSEENLQRLAWELNAEENGERPKAPVDLSVLPLNEGLVHLVPPVKESGPPLYGIVLQLLGHLVEASARLDVPSASEGPHGDLGSLTERRQRLNLERVQLGLLERQNVELAAHIEAKVARATRPEEPVPLFVESTDQKLTAKYDYLNRNLRISHNLLWKQSDPPKEKEESQQQQQQQPDSATRPANELWLRVHQVQSRPGEFLLLWDRAEALQVYRKEAPLHPELSMAEVEKIFQLKLHRQQIAEMEAAARAAQEAEDEAIKKILDVSTGEGADMGIFDDSGSSYYDTDTGFGLYPKFPETAPTQDSSEGLPYNPYGHDFGPSSQLSADDFWGPVSDPTSAPWMRPGAAEATLDPAAAAAAGPGMATGTSQEAYEYSANPYAAPSSGGLGERDPFGHDFSSLDQPKSSPGGLGGLGGAVGPGGLGGRWFSSSRRLRNGRWQPPLTLGRMPTGRRTMSSGRDGDQSFPPELEEQLELLMRSMNSEELREHLGTALSQVQAELAQSDPEGFKRSSPVFAMLEQEIQRAQENGDDHEMNKYEEEAYAQQIREQMRQTIPGMQELEEGEEEFYEDEEEGSGLEVPDAAFVDFPAAQEVGFTAADAAAAEPPVAEVVTQAAMAAAEEAQDAASSSEFDSDDSENYEEWTLEELEQIQDWPAFQQRYLDLFHERQKKRKPALESVSISWEVSDEEHRAYMAQMKAEGGSLKRAVSDEDPFDLGSEDQTAETPNAALRASMDRFMADRRKKLDPNSEDEEDGEYIAGLSVRSGDDKSVNLGNATAMYPDLPSWVPEEKIQQVLAMAHQQHSSEALAKFFADEEARAQKGFKKYDKPIKRRNK